MQDIEANSTGYEVTQKVARLDDLTGYAEEYLESSEEKEELEEDAYYGIEVGDRVVDVVTGNRGIVTEYRDGRVVFDNKDFGSCSRPAIMLMKVK